MKKPKVPSFENNPPHQEKYARGDDDWNLMTTACPVDSPKVNSGRGDAHAGSIGDTNYMRPVYSDLASYAIHDSHTNGKKK